MNTNQLSDTPLEADDTGTEATRTGDRRELPSRLGSPNEKLVYLYLHAVGGARVPELKGALDIHQLVLYPTVETLVEYGFAERTADGTVRPTDDPA